MKFIATPLISVIVLLVALGALSLAVSELSAPPAQPHTATYRASRNSTITPRGSANAAPRVSGEAQPAGGRASGKDAAEEKKPIRRITIEEYLRDPSQIRQFVSFQEGRKGTLLAQGDVQDILLPPSIRRRMEEGFRLGGLLENLPGDATFDTPAGFNELLKHAFNRAAELGHISTEKAARATNAISASRVFSPAAREAEANRVVNNPAFYKASREYENEFADSILSRLRERVSPSSPPSALRQGGGGNECYGERQPDYQLGMNAFTCECDECCICIESYDICILNGCEDGCRLGGSEVYIWDQETLTCGCGQFFEPLGTC